MRSAHPPICILLFVFSYLFLISHLILLLTCVTKADGYDYKNINHSICKSEEREALLQFKQHINVDSCGFLSSWESLDCCQWLGVHCSNHTGQVVVVGLHIGGATDSDGFCSEFCLEGKVSPSLVELKHLRYLDLSCNDFSGHPIPNFLGSFPNLKHLNLSWVYFAGEIPHQLGNLSLLTSLDLSWNYLFRNDLMYVKSLEWLSRLTLLRYLDLSGVDLSQATGEFFQAINNLPFLRVLHAELCHLSPPTYNARSLSLSYLHNYSSNPNNAHLSIIDLSRNNLNGTWIWQWLFNLSQYHLVYMDLSYNSIPGPIPSYFWNNLPSLSHLDLSSNRFEGSLPTTISNLKHLTLLDLSNNNLHCSLQCVKALADLCSLQSLSLANNNINEELSNIIQYGLSGCTHKSLVSLDLSSNRIWGSIPDNIGLFSSLQELSISANQLNGTITQNLSQLTMLEELGLSGNSLQGTLSHKHLSNLSKLRVLDVSNNSLSQQLPNCWTNFHQLQILHLENNKFFGNIPTSIGSLKRLEVMHLSNNNFSGELPTSLKNCKSLLVIDIGYNSLTGSIPQGIGATFKNLIILKLQRNRFYGRLPISLCELSNLHILDLSSNHFLGTIPTCVSNLKAMANASNLWPVVLCVLGGRVEGYQDTTSLMWKGKEQIFNENLPLVRSIDVSNNHLEGHIPHGIYALTALLSLDLSNNNLIGDISPDIGKLKSLEFLNISNNHLDGRIPTSLATVSSLGILDVSNNNLSGKIPPGTQLQGFNVSAYMGNPQLCGPPLPKCSGGQRTNDANNRNQDENNDNKDDTTLLGLYISVILGFIVGFWGVCGTLVLKRSWRVAFFQLSE